MIDLETNQPIVVNTEGTGGPYLMIPLEQLPAVERVLRENQIAFQLAEDAIRLNDHPVIAIVNFSSRADASRIQRVLDAA